MELDNKELKSLIKRAKKKDKEAFELLFKAYYERIFKFMVYKTGNPEIAEDLTQQTFLDAFSGIENFRWLGGGFSSWLLRIAYFKSMDYFRQLYKNKEDELKEDELSSENVENIYMDKEKAKELKEAINLLKDNQKKVIEHRFIAGLNLEETAISMGKSIGAIKVLQFRALGNLKKILGDKND